PLMLAAIKQRDIRLLVLVLDLLVPPLSLFVLILGATIVANLFAILIDPSSNALLVSASCLSMVILAIIVAWANYGRDILPVKSLGQVPFYLVAKFRTYVGALLGHRVSLWTRADRS